MGGAAQIGGQTLGAVNNLRSQGVPSVLTPEATTALGALASATSSLGAAIQAVQNILPTTPGVAGPSPAVLQPLVLTAQSRAVETLTAAGALVGFLPDGTQKTTLLNNINAQGNALASAFSQLQVAFTETQPKLLEAQGALAYCGSKCSFLPGSFTLPGAQTLRGRTESSANQLTQWEQLTQPMFDVVFTGL